MSELVERQFPAKALSTGLRAIGYSFSDDIEGIINKGGADTLITKYDTDGKLIWQSNFGGSGDDKKETRDLNLYFSW